MYVEPAKPVVITPERYVLLPVATPMTGYTVKAIQCKIARGDWREGKVWRRVPDERIFIDIAGFREVGWNGKAQPNREPLQIRYTSRPASGRAADNCFRVGFRCALHRSN